jgi:hypothetical protein
LYILVHKAQWDSFRMNASSQLPRFALRERRGRYGISGDFFGHENTPSCLENA